MEFRFYPLRLQFLAHDSLHFPPGKAANILRGALGLIFKRQDPRTYASIFEPCGTTGPSGLADWPRPFVFRARHLDGCTLQSGQSFHFDLHVFTLDPEVVASFVRAFAALAHEGLGPRRGKAELQTVRRVASGDFPELDLSTAVLVEPVALDLLSTGQAPARIRVEFLSPTELKHDHRIAQRPEFPILFARIRDRISTLSELYGPGPLAIDFQAMGARAETVRMTNCQVQRHAIERRSTRTGQRHSIGGFTGFAEYQGELAEFLPYLEAARWVGVGRQAVWGKGEISLDTSSSWI
jgi:hypothetical protein